MEAADLIMCSVDASRQVSQVCASLSGSTLAAFFSHGSVRERLMLGSVSASPLFLVVVIFLVVRVCDGDLIVLVSDH